MPGPNGPRSAKLRRAFDASATKTPFFVPMVMSTRSATLPSRDSRQDRHHVARRERGVDAVEIPHVVRVDEDVQVAAHRAGLVADVSIERFLVALEIFERGPHGGGRDWNLRLTCAIRTQCPEHMKGDGGRHDQHASIASATTDTQATVRRAGGQPSGPITFTPGSAGGAGRRGASLARSR